MFMNDLRISLVQTALAWEDPQANRALLGDKIVQCGETDLIVLPEMLTTGFSMAASEHAEPMDGPTMTWLAEQAARQHAVITGSLIIRDGERRYNRLVWMQPDGHHHYYDKRHLFRLAGEHTHYCAGEQRLIVELNGWRICPMICYDLRFPVFSRNRDDYDLLIYVANWPSARHEHWKTLLVARAIENLAYVAGVNRVGKDCNQLRYRGDSCVIDMSGEVLFSQTDRECCKTLMLDAAALLAWRERLPFHLDADSFQLSP
jgi:predicted amidohydrolase